MNVREGHETQGHVESGVFIVPLIVMVSCPIYEEIICYNGLIFDGITALCALL